jgi:hypothetical protein
MGLRPSAKHARSTLFLSHIGEIMILDFTHNPIADREAILAARFANESSANIDASKLLFSAAEPLIPVLDVRPKVVADDILRNIESKQCSKVFGLFSDQLPQCASLTTSTNSNPTILSTNHISAVNVVAGKKIGKSSGSDQVSIRQPRRAAAKLDKVALKKTWDGRKSKGRKDKMTEAEKFTAAVHHTASAKGSAVSLNFGLRRESMLWTSSNPKRRLMQNLNKHLSEAGFRELPYALAFEMTPESQGGRLHLHGALDTSGLTEADIHRLSIALCHAVSFASGAIGGQRQLDIGPLHNPAGWADYSLKDMTRTARKLGIETTVMMNNPMRRLAKDHFQRFREEAVKQTNSAVCTVNKSPSSHSKKTKKLDQGFTNRPAHAIQKMSGERDQTLVGGAPQNVLHRPHHPVSRIDTSRPSAAHRQHPFRSSTSPSPARSCGKERFLTTASASKFW